MFLFKETTDENEKQFIQTIRDTGDADGDQNRKDPEEVNKKETKSFEESIEYKFSEEHVRLIPFREMYLIDESDLYAVDDYYDNDDINDTLDVIADRHGIHRDDLAVMTESVDIEEMKKEIANKLQKTKSLKQKIKLRKRLKNLNKMKFFRKN
jgi:hypothetical protein